MSDENYVPGSTANKYTYYDDDDNECVVSLWQMVRDQPEWACSRIREGEKAIAELAALKAEPALPEHLRDPATVLKRGQELLDGGFGEPAQPDPKSGLNSGECIPKAEPAQPDPDTMRDYPEDSSHENGNYYNTCAVCENMFTGHKRRFVCKVCAPKPAQPEPVGSDESYARSKAEEVYAAMSDYCGPDHDKHCINYLTFFIDSVFAAGQQSGEGREDG